MLAIACSVCASTSPIADGLAGVEVLADLAAHVDRVAGDDGLAQVVVEVLLGVGVAGVERPDPGVPPTTMDAFAPPFRAAGSLLMPSSLGTASRSVETI